MNIIFSNWLKSPWLILCLAVLGSAQSTLTHNGLTREYYVSYPANPTEPCPLIINMHGFGSVAVDQQVYSELDDYALPQNIAVVYPDGISNAWNVGTSWDISDADDVGFISALIDSVAEDFAIDLDRVYACGMSNGGYMTYELACELSDKIAAFGSVTGNFMLNANQACEPNRDIPIMHIHGTADAIVPYDLTWDGSMNVAGSIEFWRDHNDLDMELIEPYPNIVVGDYTIAEKFTYYSNDSETEFVHIKVENGGHQWFGSALGDLAIGILGLNNHDFHSSAELVNFFLQYRLSDFLETAEDEMILPKQFRLYPAYPNPFNPLTTFHYDLDKAATVKITIFDLQGRKVRDLLHGYQHSGNHKIQWNAADDRGNKLSSGVYMYQISTGSVTKNGKIVLMK